MGVLYRDDGSKGTREMMEPRPLAKILVPLDGSPRSEMILPFIAALAGQLNACLTLLTVADSRDEATWQVLETYLRSQHAALDERLRSTRHGQIAVKTVLARGDPASEILSRAEREGDNLIAMGTHGRSGIQRWLLGSVTEKVLSASDVPVLVVRNDAKAGSPVASPITQRVIVPLDGSGAAEEALPYAMALSVATRSELTLVNVNGRDGQPLLAEQVGEGGEEGRHTSLRPYLEIVQQSLLESSLGPWLKCTTGTLSGEPAAQILGLARVDDIVVMSTHGRSGVDLWTHGSVMQKVTRHATTPVLVVPSQRLPGAGARLEGMEARRCHRCGRIAWKEEVSAEDYCLRCHAHLRTCGNCIHSDGISCMLERLDVYDTYPGVDCSVFQFRPTRVILR